MTRWVRGLTGMVMAVAAAMPALAQDTFPSRPVRLLIPFPPGGAVDIVGRTLGDELARIWGQAVVVENKPGAGGVVASQGLLTAARDGYTLLLVSNAHPTTPFLNKSLPYDIFKDFAPIALVGSSTNMVTVRADSPYKSLSDLLADARAKPGSLSYGHAGVGTSANLAGEMLKALAKVDIVSVPYRGGAPALNDLLAGHIPLTINNAPESIGQIQAGAIRALGVTTAKRSPFFPDVPTIAEAGVPGYATDLWWGLLAPAGVAPEIIAKINRDCATALNSDGVKARLAQLGAAPAGGTPDVLADRIKSDYDIWGAIIKAAGIQQQ